MLFDINNVVFFHDNAKFHKSDRVKKFVEEKKLYCLCSAPYSPFLNVIEYFFGYLKLRLKDV